MTIQMRSGETGRHPEGARQRGLHRPRADSRRRHDRETGRGEQDHGRPGVRCFARESARGAGEIAGQEPEGVEAFRSHGGTRDAPQVPHKGERMTIKQKLDRLVQAVASYERADMHLQNLPG